MAVRPTSPQPRVPMAEESDPSAVSRSSDSTPPVGWRRHLHRVRAHPTGRVVFRVGVGVLGGLVVLVGIVLLPLPGPGWAIIFLGLAIWSVEFHWARRLLRFARREVARWRAWYSGQGWPMKIASGVLTALVVLAIVGGALWLSVGPQLRSLLD